MAKNDTPDTDNAEAGDEPLIDLNDATIKKLIARAKKKGVITYEELNAALPSDQMSPDQIEDIMSAISEMGVNIVEKDDSEEEEADQPEDEVDPIDEGNPRPAVATKKEAVDRTDDPVRMYLREMGAVELLSREGEIAIAKRIEAGRDTMIWGLCESPITFNAIIDWSNNLNEGTMQLREILDLDAMLSKGPSPDQINDDADDDDDGEISEKNAGPTIKEEEDVEDEPEADSDDEDGESKPKAAKVEEEDEDNTLSLAQMEEALKPMALEKFAGITALFKKFSKLQQARLEAMAGGAEFGSADEKKYQKLSEQLTAEVESVQFHAAKIEYLVDQLYSYNRRLTALGGQMLRLAERHKVPRKAFLDSYMGNELDDTLAQARGQARQEVGRIRRRRARQRRPHPRRNRRNRAGHRHLASGIPPHREPGPEGRTRSAHRQEGNGRGQPSPGDLDRQEIHQSRPAVPGSDPGGQYRPDEGGR